MAPNRSSNSKYKLAQGISLVSLALFSAFVLAPIVAVIGYGILNANKVELQRVAETAATVALGKLESDITTIDGGAVAQSIQDRADAAFQAANDTIKNAKFSGDANSFGMRAGTSLESNLPDLVNGFTNPGSQSYNSTGLFEIGQWITKRPPKPSAEYGNPDPYAQPECPSDYPCFVPFTIGQIDSDPSIPVPVNAVRISLGAGGGLKYIAPFMGLLGLESAFTVTANATVSRLKKCTVFLLDASRTATLDSHMFSNYWWWDSLNNSDPEGRTVFNNISSYRFPEPGAFTFSKTAVDAAVKDCEKNLYNQGATADEIVHWCNLGEDRYAGGIEAQGRHYKTDYVLMDTRLGQFYVDGYTAPEPMKSYLLGLHGLMRYIQTNSSNFDTYKLLVFNNAIVDSIPSIGFTQNLSYMIQLTNPDNGPKVTYGINPEPSVTAPVSPNYIERGWFTPVTTQNKKNLNYALIKAIEEVEQGCSIDDMRNIVVLSDGYMKASYAEGVSSELTSYGDPDTYAIGFDNPNSVTRALGSDLTCALGVGSCDIQGVLGRAFVGNIKISSIYSGQKISNPHYLNIRPPDGLGAVLSLKQAQIDGYRALSGSSARQMFFEPTASGLLPQNFDESAPVDFIANDECWTTTVFADDPARESYRKQSACSWKFADQLPAVYWGFPSSIMAELPWSTGGAYCMLLPLDNQNNYTAEGCDLPGEDPLDGVAHYKNGDACSGGTDLRSNGSLQYFATEYLDPQQYVPWCMQDVFGSRSPYVLQDLR